MSLASGQDQLISSSVPQPTLEKPGERSPVQVETAMLDREVEKAVLVRRPTGRKTR